MSYSFETVKRFENQIAAFFGAPFAVATDSCTSGIELCLRYCKVGFFPQSEYISCPKNTYLSIPMLADKLNIGLKWRDQEWKDYYYLNENIIDAAVLWKGDSYIPGTFMSVSFQHQKHLSIGRAGMVLTDNKEAAVQLKKMSYDGRDPGIPWREQNINQIGYHYYLQPELAALGLEKLDNAIASMPRLWSWKDYPDLTNMDVFKNNL